MREYHLLQGGRPLSGVLSVSGAKNAALPLLMATLLTEEECVLTNVPNLEDISVTLKLIEAIGAETVFRNHEVRASTKRVREHVLPFHLVKMLRSSFWALGPLLARAGSCRMPLPGGDAIGQRPVDIHLKGLSALGADIRIEDGVVAASVPGKLHAARIRCDYPSVGATHHLLMTAALVAGETVIENAAREPEVAELAAFLSAMGAEIDGIGEDTLCIRGRESLGGAKFDVMGDRIEASTYLAAAMITGGRVTVGGVPPAALRGTLSVLEEAGCEVLTSGKTISAGCVRRPRAVSFETAPFPGVATDVQPLLMAALAGAEGISTIQEMVFENRFGHVAEYRKFGARISVAGRKAVVTGIERLHGAAVEAGDIRAAAGLVLLGLAAAGETEISGVHHLDRGYEALVEKLCSIGASALRVPAFDGKEAVFGC
jgi:UDP-N-acetylglucosamine 1-carboxyvinyltransferase